MSETSKEDGKEKGRQAKTLTGGNLSDEQKSRPYYYDDACGYEVYQPEDDGEENDAEEDSPS
ncbi:MAG TPA: hypothetical protein VL572_13700 [Pyrinomonadaceae bacterium]|nr:hypothetical protein [Pyrinomonadaceae bacterium]HVQ56607.1 hypothetical protein [Pyrinomonadaceae bacterium]